MRRWLVVLAIAAVTLGCSSDVRLLRRTSASYASEVARFDRKCVNISEPKAPPECPKQEAELLASRSEIDGYIQAFLLGPLPPSARQRLEQIAKQYEPTPVAETP